MTDDPWEETRLRIQADAIGLQAQADLIRGSVDRACAAAESVQRAAAAVGGIYGALAALAFSAGDAPLPVAGLLPALFLAAAIGFSTMYLAYVSPPPPISIRKMPAAPVARQMVGLAQLSDLAQSVIHARVRLLRRATVALTLGIALLPVPFITVDDRPLVSGWLALVVVTVGVGLVFGVARWYVPPREETAAPAGP